MKLTAYTSTCVEKPIIIDGLNNPDLTIQEALAIVIEKHPSYQVLVDATHFKLLKKGSDRMLLSIE